MNKVVDFLKNIDLNRCKSWLQDTICKQCCCSQPKTSGEYFSIDNYEVFDVDVPVHDCGNKSCNKFQNKIPKNFEDWQNKNNKYLKVLKNDYVNRSMSMLKRMSRTHQGSFYYPNKQDHIIELKNVSKWYFNKLTKSFQQILFNVNLAILQGEFVVILGESGSGKTTLLNILSGMGRASNGEVIVANHNLINMSESMLTKFRKKYVSIIFQNYALTTDLTIKENVDFGISLQEDVRKRLDADLLYEKLSIVEQKDKFPSQLSGGQQQRTAIAKALAKNPKILFADEPTGAVDTETCENILKIFKDINKQYGSTIILITHNQTISQIATKIVKIKGGKIVEILTQKPKEVHQVNWDHEH